MLVKDTSILALKVIGRRGGGGGGYFGPLCYGFDLDLPFWGAYQGHVRFLWESKISLFHLYSIARNELHICSNKHGTGLVNM